MFRREHRGCSDQGHRDRFVSGLQHLKPHVAALKCSVIADKAVSGMPDFGGDRSPPYLYILQVVLIQPEIVAQFMDNRSADLFADFGLAGADRFNILLVKHDVIGPRR